MILLSPFFSAQEELGQRSPIQKAQASYGGVFEADSVARDICRGVERGEFLITHGFDGFLLGIIAAGMSPVYHCATLINQVSSLLFLAFLINPHLQVLYVHTVKHYHNHSRKHTSYL